MEKYSTKIKNVSRLYSWRENQWPESYIRSMHGETKHGKYKSKQKKQRITVGRPVHILLKFQTWKENEAEAILKI